MSLRSLAADLNRGLAPPAKRAGAKRATLEIQGHRGATVSVAVTYDWHGGHWRATEIDDAEPPYAELVTATIGGVDVLCLDEKLGISAALDDATGGDE